MTSQIAGDTANSAMIFHLPAPLAETPRSGSQVRPLAMANAFRELGYEVELVVGYGKDRQRAMRRLSEQIAHGREIAFAYSESTTMPTPLTEKHHLPFYPTLDYRFFKTLRRNGVPVGLFYRDAYWRYQLYRDQVPWYKRMVSLPLYQYDWWSYQHTLSHLFLPSLPMAKFLPPKIGDYGVDALPPGCTSETAAEPSLKKSAAAPLNLLYIGGISPPLYDLRPLLQALHDLPTVTLTICCRPNEWETNASIYREVITDNVKIVHAAKGELDELYRQADLFALIRSPHEYLDIAMPVKLFEAIGHGTPLVIFRGTAAAAFVEEEGLGYVVDDLQQFRDVLSKVAQDRSEITRLSQQIRLRRESHTWLKRAETVAQTLTGYRNNEARRAA